MLQRVLLSPSLDSREVTDLEHGEGTEPSPMTAGAEKTIGKAVPKVSCSLNSNPTRTVASLFPFTAHFHPLRSPSPVWLFQQEVGYGSLLSLPQGVRPALPAPCGLSGAHALFPARIRSP